MSHVKRFNELNEGQIPYGKPMGDQKDSHWNFYHNDVDILDGIIEGMRPGKNNDNEEFKSSLKEFNKNYPCTQNKRLPAEMGKQVAWWIDLYLIQDCIDRMNSVLCPNAEQYKKDLKTFLEL